MFVSYWKLAGSTKANNSAWKLKKGKQTETNYMCMNSRSRTGLLRPRVVLKLTSPSCVKSLLCLLPRLSKCRTTTRIKLCQTSIIQNSAFEVKLCWSRIANANTSKPRGRIPIPYGSVGKGFSVPVPHPHPAPHRVPPRPHTFEDRHRIAPLFSAYSINWMTSFSWRHPLKMWLSEGGLNRAVTVFKTDSAQCSSNKCKKYLLKSCP